MPESPYFAGKAMSANSADHVALDDEVVGAAACVGSLSEQDAVEIAVIGHRLTALLSPISFCVGATTPCG